MKRYVSNVLIYLAALFGLIAFIGLFSSPLKIYNEIQGSWTVYGVKAYLGETSGGIEAYKGTFVPVIGFVLPLIISITLIIETFQPSWNKKLSIINTLFAVLYFVSAILVLLTKEMFLKVNDLGDTLLLRNGAGPIMAAIMCFLSGIILLVIAWFPHQEIKFIEK